jgi:mannose-1-phosphate guanylyltransferase
MTFITIAAAPHPMTSAPLAAPCTLVVDPSLAHAQNQYQWRPLSQDERSAYQVLEQSSAPLDYAFTRHHEDGTEHILAVVASGATPKARVEAFLGKGGLVFQVFLTEGDVRYVAFPGAEVFVPGYSPDESLRLSVLPQDQDDSAHTFAEDESPKSCTLGLPTGYEQAMVLGAGIGTRIFPLTTDDVGVAKPALPFVGETGTVIGQLVLQLARMGMKRVFINTCQHRDSVCKALEIAQKIARNQGHPIEVIEVEEGEPTGTAGALRSLLLHPDQYPDFNPSQPLLVLQGDSVMNAGLASLLHRHEKVSADVTIGCKVAPDDQVSQFGIIRTDKSGQADPSGWIQAFKEKPSLEEAGTDRLASTGIYILGPNAYSLIRTLSQGEFPEGVPLDYAHNVFPTLLYNVPGSRLWAEQVDGYWFDIGNPHQYANALRLFLSGNMEADPCPEPMHRVEFDSDSGAIYWPHTRSITLAHRVQLNGSVIAIRPFVC